MKADLLHYQKIIYISNAFPDLTHLEPKLSVLLASIWHLKTKSSSYIILLTKSVGLVQIPT